MLVFFNTGDQSADNLGGYASKLVELGSESFGDGSLVLHHLSEFPVVDSQVCCEAFDEVEVVFHPRLELGPGKLSLGCVAAHGNHEARSQALGQSLVRVGVNHVTA